MEKMSKYWGAVTLQETNINIRMVSCRKLLSFEITTLNKLDKTELRHMYIYETKKNTKSKVNSKYTSGRR